ncbi:putative CCR4-associated factor 1 homolog 11 [Curcuma longa]|uniref:putative CCR4-associated factor 1 homolog 11 n=1 Tax=Curcuma longa TaxID=136217 RepID=UPI003D9EF2CE
MGSIDVWEHNLEEQLELIAVIRPSFPIVALDIEFSGFIHCTPRYFTEQERYRDVKYNVDNLYVIQLGFALFDDHGSQPMPHVSWQINFSDYDPEDDPSLRTPLRKSGIDLQRNRQEGVSIERCATLLREKVFGQGGEYVTFHGLYDVAYLLKILSGGKPLPDTLGEFITEARNIFGGRLFDLKYMARFCHGLLGGELGLMKLANLLNVEADGVAHQAGFDSLVTGLIFHELHRRWEIDYDQVSMILYGLESACQEIKSPSNSFDPLRLPLASPRSSITVPLPIMHSPCPFPSQPFGYGDGGGVLVQLPTTPNYARWFPAPIGYPFHVVAVPSIIF